LRLRWRMSPRRTLRIVFIHLLYSCALLAAFMGVARAQAPQPPPAYIVAVEGSVTLDRDGDVQPAVEKMPIVAGDRLRTTAGRAEIRFPDGTGIEVDEDSEI